MSDEDETPELDPALLALLGDPRAAQQIDLPQIEETVVTPREDGDDYQTSRDKMHTVLGKTLTAIEQMGHLAWQSQHPRAYEVLANLLKTAADVNKDLLVLKEKDQKLKGEVPASPDDGPKSVTYNDNRLVLTSDQLLKITRDQIKQIEHERRDNSNES